MTIENLGGLTLRVNGPEIIEYANSDYSLHNVPYDSSVSIHFITKINSDLTAELVDNKSPYAIIIHNTGEDIYTRKEDSFEVTVPSDGYYEVITLIVPTKVYVEDVLGLYPGSKVNSDLNTNIIAADVNGNSITLKILTHTLDLDAGYNEHIWADWNCISLPDVLLMLEMAESENLLNKEETNIKKFTLSAFVYDNLYACYISKASDLLNKYTGSDGFCGANNLCPDNINKYKSEIQIRDYLWMAINVINYCVQNCQYLKALKILDCVSTCSGICSDVKATKSTTKKLGGCGCGKRT